MKRGLIAFFSILLIGVAAYLFLKPTTVPQNSPAPVEVATSSTPTSTTLQSVPVHLSSGTTFTLNIPGNYTLSVAAEGFHHARFMTWSPDHRVFVGEMTNASDTKTGRVLILDGFNAQTGSFASTHIYLDNLRNPNSVAFYRDQSGQEWIYIALTDKLIRYPYAAGDNVPSAAPQTIATFPDFGPTAAAGGWHLTRTLLFAGDQLFVSVGSGCNSCEETGVVRGNILVMNPDGSGSRIYADGLRNAVGLAYANESLYATANEADHLGNDRPNDVVYKIQDGANYGWPYCYQFENTVYADSSQAWKHPYDCAQVPLAWAVLPPHSAPLGITYVDSSFADPALRDSFLVAMHGSGKPAIATGYAVAAVKSGAAPATIIDGFLQNDTRVARPVDVLMNNDHSFFLSDDMNGAIYYLNYTP